MTNSTSFDADQYREMAKISPAYATGYVWGRTGDTRQRPTQVNLQLTWNDKVEEWEMGFEDGKGDRNG